MLSAESGQFKGVAYLFLFSHSGKDEIRNVREYLSCITQAIQERVAAMLASANLFVVLSDGSEAQRSGSDKELVMVCVERNGKIVFLIWLHCYA